MLQPNIGQGGFDHRFTPTSDKLGSPKDMRPPISGRPRELFTTSVTQMKTVKR
jgi:hypothetical protein